MLSQKLESLEKKIEQELMTTKKHGTKNKCVALQALKPKKRSEMQLAQIDGTCPPSSSSRRPWRRSIPTARRSRTWALPPRP